ncbi:hypothetical protein PRZ48_005965 [Zasmidium cellare]|uniref:NTF2-like domain-containing protein n=1 Tax=Zasmidium cellare TaxID=395010 RepID=A0ABR0EMR0_ZASCE|nr:hypothetical protein PRZ48_005965 [Zasmidium cellare]
MKLLSIIATLSLTILVYASHDSPLAVHKRNQTSITITQSEAAAFVADFATLFSHAGDWKATAVRILDKDVVFASNSFLTRRLELLASPNTTGIVTQDRDALIDILGQVNVSNIVTNDLLITTCGKIVWKANFGAVGPVDYPVKVIIILTLERAKKDKRGEGNGRLVATEVENEYDGMGWSIGDGRDCSACAVSKAPEPYV